MSLSRDIDLAGKDPNNLEASQTLLDHQDQQYDATTNSTPRSHLLETISLIAAYIHLNIAVALLLSLAFSEDIWLHFILWFPFLIGSAKVLHSSALCRRQAFLCLAISATSLWLVVMCFVAVPGLWEDGE